MERWLRRVTFPPSTCWKHGSGKAPPKKREWRVEDGAWTIPSHTALPVPRHRFAVLRLLFSTIPSLQSPKNSSDNNPRQVQPNTSERRRCLLLKRGVIVGRVLSWTLSISPHPIFQNRVADTTGYRNAPASFLLSHPTFQRGVPDTKKSLSPAANSDATLRLHSHFV